jgi:hypothetical protein
MCANKTGSPPPEVKKVREKLLSENNIETAAANTGKAKIIKNEE